MGGNPYYAVCKIFSFLRTSLKRKVLSFSIESKVGIVYEEIFFIDY